MDASDLFEILVRENADMLTTYIRSAVRDPGLADDVFQETMLTAWRRLGDYDKSRPFGPWLRGIASRVILSQRRDARSLALFDEGILEQIGARHEELHRQRGDLFDEKLDGLRQCIADLPDHYREVIQMKYTEAADIGDVADRLGVSFETVKKRLQRGRARLLDCLKRKLALAVQ